VPRDFIMPRLIRWARRHWAELGLSGLIIAVLFIVVRLLEYAPESVHSEKYRTLLGVVVEAGHAVEALVAVVAALVIFVLWFASRTGRNTPPSGPLGLLHFLELPSPPDVAEFSFRCAQAEIDLQPFIAFSDDEVDIANRHPELVGSSRWDLYSTWFRINRQAFLLLDKRNEKTNAWETIAVSIVLPLTGEGCERLSKGRVSVVDLRDLEIARQGLQPAAFLVDTWIVKKIGRARRIDRPIRESHKKYARALLYVHIGIFWDSISATSFLVEADNSHIRSICEDIGFDGSQKTKDGEVLQQLRIPSHSATEEVARRLTIISKNIELARSWSIVGLRP
jgi:hypothetical protein